MSLGEPADERRLRPEAGYIRRLDPDWVAMVKDVADVKETVAELLKSNHRQERYLVGGWNEGGTEYVVGIRDRVGTLERYARWFWLMAAGIWAVALTLIVESIRGGIHV